LIHRRDQTVCGRADSRGCGGEIIRESFLEIENDQCGQRKSGNQFHGAI
jgi:hypothetical protein